MVSEFARLRQFLEEQHGALLAQLEGLEGDILKQRDEFDTLVSGERSRFSALITELEEKKERSARELLTVRPAAPAAWPPTSHLHSVQPSPSLPVSSPCRVGPRTRGSEFQALLPWSRSVHATTHLTGL